ncbi:protein of unknown function [Petrocella atlantisensis]|uniref:Uncharacterized protein n=1 Tax=Petrocella atlantisensis TaxID=2173034 RepID=A0A3P7RWQ8_9FIRM|nr:protein of unknown function [Petrocella atlantisensis]
MDYESPAVIMKIIDRIDEEIVTLKQEQKTLLNLE